MAESDRSVCTIQTARSQASLGTPGLQNAGQVQTSLKEITGISTLRGMHRCRHSAADNHSQHLISLTLCRARASGKFLWECDWGPRNKGNKSTDAPPTLPCICAVTWLVESISTLLLIYSHTADGCVITLLL